MLIKPNDINEEEDNNKENGEINNKPINNIFLDNNIIVESLYIYMNLTKKKKKALN